MNEALLAGRLVDGGHELVQRVYFEDTDFSGRVYHARYLHFLERGRSDFLRLRGIHHRELAQEGLAFAVRRMEIDFRGPAQIDDLLLIRTHPLRVGGARIELEQTISRAGKTLVQAVVTVALVGPGPRPARLPTSVRRALGAAASSPAVSV